MVNGHCKWRQDKVRDKMAKLTVMKLVIDKSFLNDFQSSSTFICLLEYENEVEEEEMLSVQCNVWCCSIVSNEKFQQDGTGYIIYILVISYKKIENIITQSIEDNFSLSRPINDQPPNSLSNKSINGCSERFSIFFTSTQDA